MESKSQSFFFVAHVNHSSIVSYWGCIWRSKKMARPHKPNIGFMIHHPKCRDTFFWWRYFSLRYPGDLIFASSKKSWFKGTFRCPGRWMSSPTSFHFATYRVLWKIRVIYTPPKQLTWQWELSHFLVGNASSFIFPIFQPCLVKLKW